MLEVLVASIILSFSLLAVARMQAIALQNEEYAYNKSVALTQLQSMLERVRSNIYHSKFYHRQKEINDWNQENKALLPNGNGRIIGQTNQHYYKIIIQWRGRYDKQNSQLSTQVTI